jgi:hypothetical protein
VLLQEGFGFEKFVSFDELALTLGVTTIQSLSLWRNPNCPVRRPETGQILAPEQRFMLAELPESALKRILVLTFKSR